VECTVKATDSEEPVYVYDAAKDAALMGIEGNGPVIASADFRSPFDNCELPPEVRKAVILYRGELTPDYKYLSGCLGPLTVS
jgi:alpha-aminoadipic semialdehyde synthase